MKQVILFNLFTGLFSSGLIIFGYTLLKNSRLSKTLLISKFSSYLNVLLAIGAFTLYFYHPGTESTWLVVENLGIEFCLDALNSILLVMVSFIGLVVSRFSRSYLEGDPNHKRFIGLLAGVISSVQLLLLSANLLTFFIAWVATSWFLQKLLTIYGEREKAKLAARKEFILARIGDLALLLAFSVLYFTLKTGNISKILELIETKSVMSSGEIVFAGCCLVLTAVLKAAQFPLHGWLIEVMEAPTPVSAILHAGLINAGPFLILRFVPIINYSFAATLLLFTIAFISSIYAALVFAHQPSIKNSLGYSSVAHLGFTLLLCSLGLYSAALLHLVAHSFFKAYQFLSSGSEIDRNRVVIPMKPRANLVQNMVKMMSVLVISCLLFLFAQYSYGDTAGLKYIFFFFLFAITAYALRLTPFVNRWSVYLGTISFIIITMMSFYFFEKWFGQVMNAGAHSNHIQDLLLIIAVFTLSLFILLRIFILHRVKLSHNLIVHLRNGFYVNTLINRLFGAYSK
jgi:NAD(P)H-quinone oxidoreductase subunit 5